MKKISFISTAIYLFLVFLILFIYYFFHPVLNFSNPSLYVYLFFIILFVTIVVISKEFRKEYTEKEMNKKNIFIIFILSGILLAIIIIPLIIALFNTSLFNAKTFASRIEVKDAEFSTIKEVEFDKIPIIDEETAWRLGNKVMGNLPELVSQFDVSNEYTQISYQNSIYRVTPLAYNGFIKWTQNKDEGIPGYIKVNCVTGETTLVKLKDLGLDGMKYVPSAFFNNDLMRHLQFTYKDTNFGSPSFEIDEEGRPWYISTTYSYHGIGNRKTADGVIVLDPITGESQKYDLDNVPSWIDRVYPVSLVSQEFNHYGKYQDGFWNSVFGQKGVVQLSDGYNYIEQDGDIWMYSGITSANSDSSNLGFVLINLRTHEARKISVASADEYAAMESSESEVKNYGYNSNFPLLINIKGNPTYLMALKGNGLVKMYAMVSAIDYQKVSVVNAEDGLESLKKTYLANLNQNEEDIETEILKESIEITQINSVIVSGNSYYFLVDKNNVIFEVKATESNKDTLVFLKTGDIINVEYQKNDTFNSIKNITK